MPPSQATWAVLAELTRQRWGGDLRRSRIFERLAERTEAQVVEGWSMHALREAVGSMPGLPFLPAVRLRGPRTRLASAEMLPPIVARVAKRVASPAAVAIYDDPVAQAADLGIRLAADRERYFRARRTANASAFRWYVVPTASFADYIGLDRSRVIVGGNGTDTDHILPGEWPHDPAIGMASGAAPGRGIETLLDAARLLHADRPELRLLLWLVATGPGSDAYLESLRDELAAERWIEIGTAPYEDLPMVLRQATVLTIPHPPGEYHDIALPVKLLDSMAAGRPLVVTPRREIRAIVERHGAGLVTSGETADDLAATLARVIDDERLAQRLGAAARTAAVEHYDWAVVGDRIASAVLDRETSVEGEASTS